MQCIITRSGGIRCVYDEALDVSALGHATVSRASHVEPDAGGRWWADLTPVAGPRLGPFERRSLALQAEMQWLDAHLSDLPL